MDWTLFLMAIIGVIAHLLSKYVDSVTTKTAFDWKQHCLFAAYSSLIICAIIFAGDEWDILSTVGLTLSKGTAFILGYFSDSVVKNFSAFNPFKGKV